MPSIDRDVAELLQPTTRDESIDHAESLVFSD
jgi:hypothetical protein